MNDKETLVLVDGSSLAYRSFYALLTTGMRTKTGVPTWAIMGFFNSLFDMMDRQAPHMLAVCFDLSGPTFRHEEYEQYKAHRQEMPDDLAVQWPLIKRGLTALHVPVLEVKGYEADDVIGTIAKKAAQEGRRVTILTGDQDTFQLVDDDDDGLIDVLMPSKTGLLTYKRQQVFEKLGVWPEQIIDYKGLCGDTSDNIPGVRGVGPKTAVKLLSDYGTVEGIYAHIDEISSASLKSKLVEGKERAFASKRLATIMLDVPVDFSLEACQLTMPVVEQAAGFFKSMQFRGLISRLPMVLAKSFSYKEETERTQLEKELKSIISAVEAEPITFADIHGGSPPERSTDDVLVVNEGVTQLVISAEAVSAEAGSGSATAARTSTATGGSELGTALSGTRSAAGGKQAGGAGTGGTAQTASGGGVGTGSPGAASGGGVSTGGGVVSAGGVSMVSAGTASVGGGPGSAGTASGGAAAPGALSPVIELPKFTGPPAPRVVSDEQALDELVHELSKTKILSLSLETTSAHSLDCDLVGISFSWGAEIGVEADGSLYLSSRNGHNDLKTAYIPLRHQHIGAEQLEPDLVTGKLKPILESEQIAKVAHNAKAEMNALSLLDIELAHVVFDPMLASYVRNPDERHGLKEQADRLFNYALIDVLDFTGSGKNKVASANVQIETVARCKADSARVILELARYYAACLDEEQTYLLYSMELPVSRVLAHMEQTGIAIDKKYLSRLSEEISLDMAQLEKDIYSLAGHSFNINSTQQLQKVLFEELGLHAKVKTKTGSGYSTDASVLEDLKDEHEIIAKILDYRHLSKLRSTYVDALPAQMLRRDGRVHGEFNQTVAATGRLSSSNPNLQNIPIKTDIGRKIRRAFIAGSPTASLISADYSQIELRMLAHMSGDETLIDAFQKDQDIHARTAMEIFDVPIDKVDANMRRVAKTLNFALIYQQGPFATARSLGITTTKAKEFIEKYFTRYPSVKSFMSKTIQEARTNNFVQTLWGRRRFFRHLQDRNSSVKSADERAACNAPLQGSAADLMKLAMIELDKRLKESGLKAKLVLQVHDELVLETPDTELNTASKILRGAMEMGQPLKVPLKVDLSTGKNWMDAK